MTRFVPTLLIVGWAAIGTAFVVNAEPPDATELPAITMYNGTGWAPLERHAIWVTGAGAAKSGEATATLKSKLDGPKTYVVMNGSTSETVINDPKPHFRIQADRATAVTIQLAQFETNESVRSTTIERVRRGVFFTKGIDLEVIQISEGIWELRPTKSLEPGEYALATTDSDPVADFTVEAKGY